VEENKKFTSVELSEELLEAMDCVILVTDHSSYNYQWLLDHSKIFVDTRNVTKGLADPRKAIVKL
jgi:UDP-N-acetyl-D-glucosamine dehydrogenase